jgi:chondroitin-sulfate-ABC endolyase/exolyase
LETGSDYAAPLTTANAAKAFINHGVKPSAKNYVFVAIPGTNPVEMQSLTNEMANEGGAIYQIHAQNTNLHALTYLPNGITAYTFFAPMAAVNIGIVKATTNNHLLMHREDELTGRQYFAAANPDLSPVNDLVYGWKSSNTQTTITLAGEWLPLYELSDVLFHPPSNGLTQVTLNFHDGEPLYFVLKRPDDTGLDITTQDNWIKFSENNDFLWLIPSEILGPNTIISIYSSLGKLIYQTNVNIGSETFAVPLSGFEKGMYVCKIQVPGKKIATYKWVK